MLNELSSLLHGVDWHKLGVCLNVPPGTLSTIEEDYPRADRRIAEVVKYVLFNDPSPNWEVFADAVEKMEHSELARSIRRLSTDQPSAGVLIIDIPNM